MARTITLLNGFDVADPAEDRVVSSLRRVMNRPATSLREVVVRDLRLGDCSGCFDCFAKTPGTCKMQDDAPSVLRQILGSDVVLVTGRISFGGYSSVLKRMIDRILPLTLPFYRKAHGDTHHPPRYPKAPRLVAVGTLAEGAPNPRQSDLYRTLVGRNAINLNVPSYAAEVIHDRLDADELDRRLRDALDRTDPWPLMNDMKAHWPAPHPCTPWETKRPHRLLAIVGSPKNGPSNSSVLSAYLEGRMRNLGWETETYVLRGDIRNSEGRSRLVAAVDRADLVSLATPLYVDSLHCRVTRALELLANERARWSNGAPKRFVATLNCGFPEAHQNIVALALCEQFAATAGWTWAGGLALGGGEMLCAQPLDAAADGRPPTRHLRTALDSSAEALHRGETIPEDAQVLFDRSPIPGLPRWLWHAVFRRLGAWEWRRLARKQGAEPRTFRVRPLA